MTSPAVTIKGDEELQRLLKKLSPLQNPELVTKAMRRSADLLRIEIRANIQGPRPIKLGVDSGELLGSIKNVKERYPWQVRVGTRIRWAGKYEFGPIRDRRPFLAPAEEYASPRIFEIFYAAYGQVIRHG